MNPPVDTLEVARAIAAHGLPGSMTEPPDEPLADDQWDELLTLASAEGLTGLLQSAVADHALPIEPHQAELLHDVHREAVRRQSAAEEALRMLVLAFEEANVTYRVFGGSATANIDYRSHVLRPCASTSVLVLPEDRDRADMICSGTLPQAASTGQVVVASPARIGECTMAELFSQEPDEMYLNGCTAVALARSARFLLAGVDAATNGMQSLILLRDLAQMHLANDLDSSQTLALIALSRLEADMADAVTACWHVLALADVTAVSAWASHYRRTPRGDSRSALDRLGRRGRREVV